MRLTKAIVLAIVALLIPVSVLASTIANAGYFGRIIVSNNGTSASNVSTIFSFNTTAMINAGMISANASDVAIRSADGADTAFMPGYSGNPWVLFTPIVTETGTRNYFLYSNNVSGGLLVYSPGTAGMNTTDNASLELGSNFTISQTGFVHSPGVAGITVSGNGSLYYTLTPDGAGSVTDIPTLVGAATQWEALLTNDGSTSYIAQATATTTKQTLVSVSNVTATNNITSVTVFMVGKGTGAGDRNAATLIRVGTNTTAGATLNLSISDWTTYNTTYTTNPNNGLAWTWANINGLEIGAQVAVSAGNTTNITQVYAWVNVPEYTAVTVSASGISSGNHTVTVTANSVNISILLDSVLQATASLGTYSVPNTTSNWTFLSTDSVDNLVSKPSAIGINITNGSMPYLTRQQIWVGGNLRQDISWRYASTFADASGNGNTAIPSFRTATSNANVTANISSFTNYQSLPIPPVSSGVNSFNLYPATVVEPANMYSELNMTFFGAGAVSQFASDIDMPISLAVFIYAFGVAVLLGGAAFLVTTGVGMKGRVATLGERSIGHQGSLFVMSLVMFVTLLYFTIAGGGVIPGFILIPFGVKTVSLMVMEKVPSPIG
jgi:hypothetical protein